jgi:hypothetical protein
MEDDSGIAVSSPWQGGLKTRAYDGLADNGWVRGVYRWGIIVGISCLSKLRDDEH